ncbi:MAG TPA: hypothetical protein VMV13_03755 [Candidatus Binataceae bacterium]|nr:hypothetical protein [Candidatus Binataceae bacterium]
MIKAGEFCFRQGVLPCHSRRLLSRGHPRGLFAFFGRGTGKPSAESFDDASTSSTWIAITIQVLALLSSDAFNQLHHHLNRNSGFVSRAKDYPRPRNLAQAGHPEVSADGCYPSTGEAHDFVLFGQLPTFGFLILEAEVDCFADIP